MTAAKERAMWINGPDLDEEMVTCTTCDGRGETMMRGASHRDYDEPDYMDTCGICGGTGELPARMFSDEPADMELEHCTQCAHRLSTNCGCECCRN